MAICVFELPRRPHANAFVSFANGMVRCDSSILFERRNWRILSIDGDQGSVPWAGRVSNREFAEGHRVSIKRRSAINAPDALFGKFVTCGSYDGLEYNVLAPLTDLLGAASGVCIQFFGLPLGGDAIGQVRHVGVGQRAIAEYGDGLYSIDPMVRPTLDWLRSAAPVPDVGIRVLSEIDGWRDGSIYRRFLERFDIEHVLAVAVPIRTVLGPQCVCIGFHRGKGQPPFAAADLDHLRRYVPVLQPVISCIVHDEAVELCGALYKAESESALHGYLVVDEDLRVRHASASAVRRFGFDIHGRGCNGRGTQMLGELRQRLLAAVPDGSLLDSKVPSSDQRGSSGAVTFRVQSIPWFNSGVAYLVTLTDNGCEMSFDSACGGLRLSQREREVAKFVCRGLRSVVIAEQMGIATRTVENHLRSIYAKANVRSRTQLIAQLLRLN